MKTLAAELAAHLEIKKITQAELGRRSGVDKAVIWKLFNNRAVPKGETFRKILTKGFGYAEGSKAYNDLFGMWTNEKNGSAGGKAMISLAVPGKDASSVALRNALSSIPTQQMATVIAAIADPEIRALLPALLKLRER